MEKNCTPPQQTNIIIEKRPIQGRKNVTDDQGQDQIEMGATDAPALGPLLK